MKGKAIPSWGKPGKGASANWTSLAANGPDPIAQVKEIQRTDPIGKEQWEAYTDQFGNGMRDPNKHEPQFVATFIESLNSGVKYEIKNNLAELLKEGQRKSSSWKRCWTSYCQQFGSGLNDPSKHDAAFCTGFLDFICKSGCEVMQSGGMIIAQATLKRASPGAPVPMAPGASDKDQLVLAVKAFQRGGADKKELWSSFCDSHAGGTRDPTRHELQSLQTFLAQQGIMPAPSVAGNGLRLGMGEGPPLKRINLGAGLAAATSTGSSRKDRLVIAVKGFQRQNDAQKEMWGAYCDSNLSGTRDPSRHDEATLEAFLREHDAMPAGAEFATPSRPMITPPGKGQTSASGKTKAQLVASVKAYQRMGEEMKQTWGAFCDSGHGGTRDPNAHDINTLEEFINEHASGLISFEDNGKTSFSTGDAEKDDLVAKIKTYQRGGEHQKDTWGAYADEHANGLRDPARMEMSLLQHFVDSYGL